MHVLFGLFLLFSTFNWVIMFISDIFVANLHKQNYDEMLIKTILQIGPPMI